MRTPNQLNKNFNTIIVAIMICTLTSCSAGNGVTATPVTATPVPWVSYSVAALSDLPTCAGDIVSRLYYVEATNSFSVCKTTGWVTLPISSRFVSGIVCLGAVSGVSGAAGTALNGVNVYYKAVLTAAGDVMSTASVTPAIGSFQVSGTDFWASSQSGASTAPVFITADFATSNWGWWNISLNRSTLVTTAVYTDSTLGAQSPVTITFLSSACTLLSF